MGTTVFERHLPSPSAIDHALAGSRQSVFWAEDAVPSRHPPLRGVARADLVVVGGGYTGLWTALRATERDPGRRVVVVEALTVGWAASSRNGGFCEASLTHGHENGVSRWPEELAVIERLGRENLDAIGDSVARYGMDAEYERTGTLSVAVEPHQVAWVENEPGYLDARGTRALVDSPTYLAGAWDRDDTALVHPAKLAAELARVARERGVQIYERSRVVEVGATGVRTEDGEVRAPRVALATNVFPSLLRRNRFRTLPVYDYVLMSEPLTSAQQRAIGWAGRQGVADMGNQFHYYRPTADGRILFGGYDAVYHPGGLVRARYEDRPATFRALAAHFLTTFPQLEGIRFSHRWAGAIDSCTRFCAFFGTARGGHVAYAAGYTGLGVGASRFGADVMLNLLGGVATERTSLRMVREKPVSFPPEPAASIGVNLVRWSMNRADHHAGRRNLLLRGLDAVGMGFDS